MSDPQQLWDLLSDSAEITIVCHDNPDPDCLASAVALGHIAAATGIDERKILYSGEISHQQNRAFVNLLDIELEPFDSAIVMDRSPGSLLALVDHSVPGTNNQLPAEAQIDIVIDHHPTAGVEATFVDRREELGATATILTKYLQTLPVDPSSRIATALLFAIRRETLNFLRGVSRHEYDSAAYLQEYADHELLHQLTTQAVSEETVDTIADAIENRQITGPVLISQVGQTNERDALPQAADYLATLEGVQTAIVFGLVDDTIQLSARSTDPRVHIGETLNRAFEDVGSAGGHREMAGGEIPLGIFSEYPHDDSRLVEIVAQVITHRLLTALNIRPRAVDTDDEDEESASNE